MFAIGDNEWPGISKLTEECGEVVQVCGKLMGSRGNVHHFDGTNLKTRLEEELGDLQAAINFVRFYCGLDADAISKRVVQKIALFDKWHERNTCAGTGRCHGTQSWCDRCGNVFAVCDVSCDVHRDRATTSLPVEKKP